LGPIVKGGQKARRLAPNGLARDIMFCAHNIACEAIGNTQNVTSMIVYVNENA